MALQFSFRKKRPINIIMKDHVIQFVEIKQENPFVVQKYGERYLPNGLIKEGKIINFEALSLILQECVDKWKIKRRKVRFHVPNSVVVIRRETIPDDVADDEIHGYIYMEIGTSIHLPFEEPVFDFTVVSSEPGKKELILFAATEEVVNDYTALFEEAKLVPIAADLSPLSLYRLFFHLKKAAITDHVMIVQFDLQSVNVCIFETHLPVFMRHITMNVNSENWHYPLTEENGVQVKYKGNEKDVFFALEDVYKEIARVLDFYQYTLKKGKQQVTKLFLDVNHPWRNEIVREMMQRTAVPIELIESELIATTNGQTLPSSYHCAAGLGLKGV